MNLLVIGAGGREHALVWKLKQSKKVTKIFCAPGNGGISTVAKCVNIKTDNNRSLVEFALRNKIDLTIVGPEQPLAAGLVDEFQKRKLRIFGPNRHGARLESSKVFAKEFMQKYHIPTAPYRMFTTSAEAIGFCKAVEFPVVIKADGLAAGKGVSVVRDRVEAEAVIESMMVRKDFGKAGERIIIESFVQGQEVSIMAITDGKTVLPLLPSQDHKQAFEGDKGPNTGGMGAYCPVDFVTPEILDQISEYVLEPAINGLRSEEIPYAGVLYAGLMLTEQGPKVLEFNCRFGDPETQAVLPLMRTDLVDIMMAVADKKLSNVNKIEWRKGAAACVVMAAKGYPGQYRTGQTIGGLDGARDSNVQVFHAGTRYDNGKWLTSGGRVLGIVGVDNDLPAALDRAYNTVKRIRFDGSFYRRDIGHRLNKGQEAVQPG